MTTFSNEPSFHGIQKKMRQYQQLTSKLSDSIDDFELQLDSLPAKSRVQYKTGDNVFEIDRYQDRWRLGYFLGSEEFSEEYSWKLVSEANVDIKIAAAIALPELIELMLDAQVSKHKDLVTAIKAVGRAKSMIKEGE